MRWNRLNRSLARIVVVFALVLVPSQMAWAANPGPVSGSIGLEGTISTAPPSTGATIAVPANGAVFTAVPITVSGLCPSGLLIKVFSNGVFIGSTVCSGGSYSLQVELFSGQNVLTAIDYDALDQAGPTSNTVNVSFNDAQFLQLGTQLTLSSIYAERGAPPGSELDWPILLNGGTGPYAISVDWGDGSADELLSSNTAGTVTIKHTYQSAGIYRVIVEATDKNGNQAFLQLVGQATGAIQSNSKVNASGIIIITKILWWPMIALVVLIFISFWVGRRYQLKALQDKLNRTRG
jgi:PKD domain-containing protein